MSQVPLIYNHNHVRPPLDFSARIIAGTIAACSFAVLLVATQLSPDPSGVETHRQLGLPPCGMLQTTGIPCMTCGMTTSFAHLAHGHLWQSLVTQPAGTVLAFCAAASFWVGGYIAITGRPSAPLLKMIPWTRILFTLLGIVLVGWMYKIAVVLNHPH